MRTFALIGIASLCIGCAHTDEWSKKDTTRQFLITGLMVADAYTTTKIQDTPGIYERSPIPKYFLGSQPETDDTIIYFGSLAITNYLIARALPSKWRPYWHSLTAIDHTVSISRNCDRDLCR